jgi:hypothetical protein
MPDNEERLAEQFGQLTKLLLTADTVADVLSHVVLAAVEVVPDADLVSVTLRSPEGRFYTPVETGAIAVELDELQYRFKHGPCVDTAREEGPDYVRTGDLATTPAWPDFGPAAAAHGFFSVLSTTLMPNAAPPRLSGALNIYSRKRDVFDTDVARDRALLLATHASLALATTEAVRRAGLERAQLLEALDSRDVIGQAKGILMQRRGLTADEAFELLRKTSQNLNVKLADVALTLATRHAEIED